MHLRPLIPAGLAAAVLAVPGLLHAQAGLTIQQKSTVNIARISNSELQQTISILGSDRARTVTSGRVKFLIISADASGTEIVRLDQDQVIKLDDKKKKFEILSLAQKRAELAKQQRDAAKAAQAEEKSDVRYSVVVDEAGPTGERKEINGFSTLQVRHRLTVVAENTKTGEKTPYLRIVSDSWVDPGQKEAAEIQAGYARAQVEALGLDPVAAGNPFARWLTDLKQEMAKVEGFPILSQVRFELAVDSTAAAAEPAEKPAPRGGLGGLGGLLGRGKSEEKKEEKPAGAPVVFSATVEVLSISRTPPGAAEFEIPAGYAKK